jgi:hypothetical protein
LGIDGGNQELAAMSSDNEEVSGCLTGCSKIIVGVLWGEFHVGRGSLHPKETHFLVVLAN